MQGKIPGAQITQNSGSPAAGGISVRLRGVNSFISGSDPLYIVDGVIVDNESGQLADLGGRSNPQNRLADLNPDDIEHIEIIRGAAAAALYGSRANNGVVQIFTKREPAESPASHRRPAGAPVSCASSSRSTSIPSMSTDCRLRGSIIRTTSSTALRRGSRTSRFEGGNDQTRYFMSGNFANEDGIMRSTSSRRTGARVNLQQQLTPTLVANVTSNYVNTNNEIQAFGEQNDYGIMGSLFFAPTNVDFRPVNGVYPLPPALGTNPLLAIDRIRNPQSIERFIGSTKVTWTPLTNLLFDYTIGLDNVGFEQSQFVPRNAVLGTAPLATGRAQSVVENNRIVTRMRYRAIPGDQWVPLRCGRRRASTIRRRECASPPPPPTASLPSGIW